MIGKIEKINIIEVQDYLKREYSMIDNLTIQENIKDKDYPKKLTIIEINEKGKDIILFGGMGYIAALYYFERIIKYKLTNVRNIFLLQATMLPDRTEALLNKNLGDVKLYSKLVTKIEGYLGFLEFFIPLESKAEIIFLCNTMHAFLPDIRIDNEIMNVNSLLSFVHNKDIIGSDSKILALYTKGTKQTGLYRNLLPKNILELSDEDTELLMNLIYKGVKSNNIKYMLENKDLFLKTINKYNFDKILFGCTEIGKLFEILDLNIPESSVVDPVTIIFDNIFNQ